MMTKREGGQKSQKIDDVFYEWPPMYVGVNCNTFNEIEQI